MTQELTGEDVAHAGIRLTGLVRLAKAQVVARSAPQLAEIVAEQARFAFGALRTSVLRLEFEHGAARVLVSSGALMPGEAPTGGDLIALVNDPLIARLAVDGEPWMVTVDDADISPGMLARLLGHGAHSSLGVPIVHEGLVWGALVVERGGDEPVFGAGDEEFGLAFAGLVSAGLAQIEHVVRVRRLAFTDPLTGLGNRRLVEERLERSLAEQGRTVTLLMADVNGLKAANDAHSHAQGDAALRALAGALARVAGQTPGSLAGRIGGDEFCLVVDGDLEVALPLAEEFVELANEVPYVRGVAVGVASSRLLLVDDPDAAGSSPRERLMRLADEAQYTAKASGSQRPVVAGRDAPVPAERRRWRGHPGLDLLPRLLTDLEGLEGDALDRLRRVASLVTYEAGAEGWVISRVDAVAMSAVPVAASAAVEMGDRPFPWPATAGWARGAAIHGAEVLADDEVCPLAAIRGVGRVGLVRAGDWALEVLSNGDASLVGVLPTLRALAAIAVLESRNA